MLRLNASSKSRPLNLCKSIGWAWTSRVSSKIWKSLWRSKGFLSNSNNLSSILNTKIAPLATSKEHWRIITLLNNIKTFKRNARNLKTKEWPPLNIMNKNYLHYRKKTKSIDLKGWTPLPSQMPQQIKKEVPLSTMSSREISRKIQQ